MDIHFQKYSNRCTHENKYSSWGRARVAIRETKIWTRTRFEDKLPQHQRQLEFSVPVWHGELWRGDLIIFPIRAVHYLWWEYRRWCWHDIQYLSSHPSLHTNIMILLRPCRISRRAGWLGVGSSPKFCNPDPDNTKINSSAAVWEEAGNSQSVFKNVSI